jgi:hypothetical protein
MPSQSTFSALIQVDPDGGCLLFEAPSLFLQEAAKAIPARNRSTAKRSGGPPPRRIDEIIPLPARADLFISDG